MVIGCKISCSGINILFGKCEPMSFTNKVPHIRYHTKEYRVTYYNVLILSCGQLIPRYLADKAGLLVDEPWIFPLYAHRVLKKEARRRI